MSPHVAGVRPVGVPPDFQEPELFCETCKHRLVRAHSDSTGAGERGGARLVEYDPVPPGRGEVVLWFEVDGLGHPIGGQRFRMLAAAEGYTGDTWIFHPAHQKPKAVRR